MPFATAEEMFAYVKEKNIPVWQAALDYERAISGCSDSDLMKIAGACGICLYILPSRAMQ